jgi:hypothetical protein
MDLVFLGGIALLWAATAAFVLGLDRLRPQRGNEGARP